MLEGFGVKEIKRRVWLQFDPEYLLSVDLRESQKQGVEFLRLFNSSDRILFWAPSLRGHIGTLVKLLFVGKDEFEYLKPEATGTNSNYKAGSTYWSAQDSLIAYNVLEHVQGLGVEKLIIMPHRLDTNICDNNFIKRQCEILSLDFVDLTRMFESRREPDLWQDASHLSGRGARLLIEKNPF